MKLVMTDQELVLAALRQVGLIVAEHLELGVTDADEAITQLVAVLDTKELADAINRLDVEPQQVVLGQAEAADGWFGF